MARSPLMTRRRALGLGAAAGLAPLWAPSLFRGAKAAASPGDRRFLFIFCQGGWDPVWAFAPLFDSGRVDMPPDAEAAEVNGIPFVDQASAPSVREFFTRYGDQCCLINGLEIQAVAHDTCMRIAMTNTTVEGGDDWAAILAGNALGSPPIPHLHLSGPAFGNRFASSIVRGGTNGQLAGLLDGTALERSDRLLPRLSSGAEAAVDARARTRAADFAARAGGGRAAVVARAALSAETYLPDLAARGHLLGQTQSLDFVDQVALPLEAVGSGVSRTAMIAYKSWQGVFNGWDTHEEISLQANHFEELFATLSMAMDRLTGTDNGNGGSLADDVTVVVLSEMGRFPRLNATGGKDHWTFTSALLIGAGVAGGRAIGAYDDDLLGKRVDLATGELSEAGSALLPGHLGATLLALGDVDPADYIEGAQPIVGAMR